MLDGFSLHPHPRLKTSKPPTLSSLPVHTPSPARHPPVCSPQQSAAPTGPAANTTGPRRFVGVALQSHTLIHVSLAATACLDSLQLEICPPMQDGIQRTRALRHESHQSRPQRHDVTQRRSTDRRNSYPTFVRGHAFRRCCCSSSALRRRDITGLAIPGRVRVPLSSNEEADDNRIHGDTVEQVFHDLHPGMVAVKLARISTGSAGYDCKSTPITPTAQSEPAFQPMIRAQTAVSNANLAHAAHSS